MDLNEGLIWLGLYSLQLTLLPTFSFAHAWMIICIFLLDYISTVSVAANIHSRDAYYDVWVVIQALNAMAFRILLDKTPSGKKIAEESWVTVHRLQWYITFSQVVGIISVAISAFITATSRGSLHWLIIAFIEQIASFVLRNIFMYSKKY